LEWIIVKFAAKARSLYWSCTSLFIRSSEVAEKLDWLNRKPENTVHAELLDLTEQEICQIFNSGAQHKTASGNYLKTTSKSQRPNSIQAINSRCTNSICSIAKGTSEKPGVKL